MVFACDHCILTFGHNFILVCYIIFVLCVCLNDDDCHFVFIAAQIMCMSVISLFYQFILG